MARTRGPGNLVAQRPRTEARTDTRAHADYAAMITHDLGGRRTTSYRAIDDGRPVGAAELLLRPVALFLFACTAFVIVLCLWLWQSGVFGQLQLRYAAPTPAPATSWIGGRQAKRVRPVDTSETPLPDSNASAPTDEGAAEASNDEDIAAAE